LAALPEARFLKLPAGEIEFMTLFIQRRRADCQPNPADDKKFISAGRTRIVRANQGTLRPPCRCSNGAKDNSQGNALGYANDLYDSHLTEQSGWTRQLLKATTKGNNGKSFDREEVVWFNPVYRRAVASGRIPLHLSKKVRHNNKVNPER